MSNEIHAVGPTGRTCYVHIFDFNGNRWNGSAFESFSIANYANYDVAVTEDGSTGIYRGNFPSAIAVGNYDIVLYIQAGASPANGDSAVSVQSITWYGADVIPPVSVDGDINFGDIKTQVQYNLGRGAETNIVAQMTAWGKWALRDIINWRDHWFLDAQADVVTIEDQQTYSLPHDYKDNMKITLRKSDRNKELDGPIDIVEANRRYSPDSNGEPCAWSHYYSEQFKVWPVRPDAVYVMQLNYQRYIADLSDDEDTNTITINYPGLLIALMTKYGFKYLQEFGDAKEWESEANRILGDIHANYVARTMGRDFSMSVRSDVRGTPGTPRAAVGYTIIR